MVLPARLHRGVPYPAADRGPAVRRRRAAHRRRGLRQHAAGLPLAPRLRTGRPGPGEPGALPGDDRAVAQAGGDRTADRAGPVRGVGGEPALADLPALVERGRVRHQGRAVRARRRLLRVHPALAAVRGGTAHRDHLPGRCGRRDHPLPLRRVPAPGAEPAVHPGRTDAPVLDRGDVPAAAGGGLLARPVCVDHQAVPADHRPELHRCQCHAERPRGAGGDRGGDRRAVHRRRVRRPLADAAAVRPGAAGDLGDPGRWHLPCGDPAVPGDAEPAVVRARVHPTKHRCHPSGVRARSGEDPAVQGRGRGLSAGPA